MKKLLALALVLSFFTATTTYARDTRLKLPIKEALNTPKAKGRLGDQIKYYFGNKKYPKVVKSYGTYQANKKTNAANKSDVEACNWVFLSAMRSLEKRAKSLGADAVINIKSYYKKNNYVSETKFECGAGALLAGSTLVGEFVKFKKSK